MQQLKPSDEMHARHGSICFASNVKGAPPGINPSSRQQKKLIVASHSAGLAIQAGLRGSGREREEREREKKDDGEERRRSSKRS